MMRVWRTILCAVTALALMCGMSAAALAADGASAEYDGAAFGEWRGEITAETREAWVNRSVSTSTMKSLLNSQTLYPQKTGWDRLDSLLESMLSGFGSDTYSQLRGMYDWLVKNVTYSWEGYSYTYASAAAYNSVTYDYLSSMTYEDGLQKSIPDDMANRAYHILTKKKGVCYDYAIAMAVTARYIGIESYVRTGGFQMEDGSGIGHHGWTVLVLNGTNYIFDAQRDARNYQYYGRNGYYFGVASSNAGQYYPNYWKADTQANAARDASMLPVTADRVHKVTLTVSAGAGGTVSGSGAYLSGTTAEVSASPADGSAFLGWYDADGNLVSSSESYTFPITDDTALTARFGYTVTVTASRSGSASGGGSYVSGTAVTLTADGTAFSGWYDEWGNFLTDEPDYTFEVRRAAAFYALFDGDKFCDISADDWYLPYAMDCAARGLVNGTTAVTFSGTDDHTRAMAAVMLARLDGADTSAAEPAPFADVPQDTWYTQEVSWAYETGVATGRSGTEFDPDTAVTRQEFLTMVVRYLEGKGYQLEEAELDYRDADEIDGWALESVRKAQGIGLIEGDGSGRVMPKDTLSRAEGAAILSRLAQYLDDNPLPAEDETEGGPTESGEPEESAEPADEAGEEDNDSDAGTDLSAAAEERTP